MTADNRNYAASGAAPTATTSPGLYRPSLNFYHANSRGTGAALRFELHPAHDSVDGSIMMTIANQLTIGDRRGPTPTYPTFDWEHKIVVKLDFEDLCKILQVFRGECESLEGEKGLFHQTARANTSIRLRHIVEPTSGYLLDIYRTPRNGEEMHVQGMIFAHEAVGLCAAITGSMSVIGFGIPMVIPHDTSAYEAEQKGFRNGRAA